MPEGEWTELDGTEQCRRGNIQDWIGRYGTMPVGKYTGLDWMGRDGTGHGGAGRAAVSYTHLTLPTRLSV